MADPAEAPRPIVVFPRRKPARVAASITSRCYAAARLVLPERWLLRFLLEAARLSRTLAWEHIWFRRPAEDALALSRPHTLPFLMSAIPAGSSVIDLGGGSGVIARAIAPRAGRVVVVDVDSRNLARARSASTGNPNIEFIHGEMLDVLERTGPFDVALLLHGLGYWESPVDVLRSIFKHAQRVVLEVPDFAADPLNTARVAEDLPSWSDALYVAEFDATTLARCVTAAGGTLSCLEARHGQLLATADRRESSMDTSRSTSL